MSGSLVLDILSGILFVGGAFFLLIGSLGMVRLPDFWSRLHAASVIDSAGVGLLLFGMMIQAGLSFITIKLVLIVLFLLITGPTATHAVANAALVSGSRPLDGVLDETEPDGEPVKPNRVRATRSKAKTAKATKPKTTRHKKS